MCHKSIDMNTKLKGKIVAIVGGGPGGLTLARLLQQRGIEVNVYERDVDEHARVQGAPLDLHDDSGIAALQQANLMDEFRQNYMPGADRMQIMDASAHVHFTDHHQKPIEDFGAQHFRPEIDRGVLRTMLVKSLKTDTIVWNSHFVAMQQSGNGWQLQFKNRAGIYADVVIGADGANSKIRPYLTNIGPFYSGITMIEGNIYNASQTAAAISSLLKGGKIMAFGNGYNILMGQKAGDAIGFYLSFNAPDGWVKQHGPDFGDRDAVKNWFVKTYHDWDPIWCQLFQQVDIPLIPRPIYCMPLNQAWPAQTNLTIIGDAAHVMPPFAGEGVNMAMKDALDVCNCLTDDTYETLQQSIAAYERMMRERASAAARESLLNGERMHSATALAHMLAFFAGLQEHALPGA